MDPYVAWLRGVLRLAGEIYFQRMEAKLWAFAEPFYAWLVDLSQHPTPEWREGLEAFLAAQEAEGRTILPESRQSIEDYLEAWSATVDWRRVEHEINHVGDFSRQADPEPIRTHPDNAYLGYRLPSDSGLTEEDAILAHEIASLTGQLRWAVGQLQESLDDPGLIEQINPFAADELSKLQEHAELQAALSELELLWTLLGYDQIEWSSWNIPPGSGLRLAESAVWRAGPEAGLQSVFVQDFMMVTGAVGLSKLAGQLVTRGTAKLVGSIGTRLGKTTRVADEAAALLRQVTREEYNRLTSDLSLVAEELSARELAASIHPGVARLNFGKAIERAVAARVKRETALSRLFQHVGRRPKSFDFRGIGRFEGLKLEITTPAEVSKHLARPYGEGLIPITYNPPVLP